MILIIGSTGLLGLTVTQQLLASGHKVRAMVRTQEKVTELKHLGAEVVIGDLIDKPSILQACQGIDQILTAVHSLVGTGKYKSEYVDDLGHRTLIDAAKAMGVSHFVYTSISGASPNHPVDFWRTKYNIEEYLKTSGLSYTILRPSAYMELHAHIFNGKSILESGKTSLLGKGTKPRNFIAVRDVAQFVILALMDPNLKNRTIDIGGLHNFTNNQVSELYGKIANISPKINHMPPIVAKGLSVILKPFQPGISRIMYMGSLPDDAFNETFDPTKLLTEFPIQLTTLEEFIHERIIEKKNDSSSM
jgi:uncharacterized protein YbjT (DUF2867 family)